MRSAAVAESIAARALGAELPSRQRARRTNDPLAAANGNTAAGRRLKDLVTAYMIAAGNPAEIERQAAVVAAAELVLIAELARERALAGTDVEVALRAQGAADRAVRRLGIKAPGEREPEPSLDAYLASRYPHHQAQDVVDDELEDDAEAESERDSASEAVGAFDDAAAISAPDGTNNAPATMPAPLTDDGHDDGGEEMSS